MTLFEPEPNVRRRIANSVWFFVWLGVTGVAASLPPNPAGHGTHQGLGLPPCPSALLLDRPCPGCGMTTSWSALLHGDLHGSLHAHPLGAVMYLIFTFSAVSAAVASLKGQRLITDSPLANRLLLTIMAGFLLFGFGRMALVTGYRSVAENTLAQVISAK